MKAALPKVRIFQIKPKGRIRKGWMLHHDARGWILIPVAPSLPKGKQDAWARSKARKTARVERLRAIASKGGSASKGTDAARVRSQKGAAARWGNYLPGMDEAKGGAK